MVMRITLVAAGSFPKRGAWYLLCVFCSFPSHHHCLSSTHREAEQRTQEMLAAGPPVPLQLHHSRAWCLLTVPGGCKLCEGRDPANVEHVLHEATQAEEALHLGGERVDRT